MRKKISVKQGATGFYQLPDAIHYLRFVFYGIGFGMFGRLERHELYYVVVVVWTFQIMLSHVWMRYFLYGPFEWAWRSLTYWKKQPFAKQAGQYPDSRKVEKLKSTFIGE